MENMRPGIDYEMLQKTQATRMIISYHEVLQLPASPFSFDLATDMGFVSTSSLPFSITITATTTMTIRKPRLLHYHNRHSSRLHFLSKCSLLPLLCVQRKCSLNLRRSCRGNAACRVPCSLLKIEEDVDDEACELVSGLELSIVEGDDSINAYLLNAVKNNNGTGILLRFPYRVACNGSKEQWITKQEPQRVRKDIDASTKWMVDEFLAAGISKKHGIILWYKDGPCFSLHHKGHGFAHHPNSPEEDTDAEAAFTIMRNWLHDGLVIQN
ncbi:hypothetical protein Peur_065655 [Populus x canadensis]